MATPVTHDPPATRGDPSGSRRKRAEGSRSKVVRDEDWEDFESAPGDAVDRGGGAESASQTSSSVRPRTPLKSRKSATVSASNRAAVASPRRRTPRIPPPAPSPRRPPKFPAAPVPGRAEAPVPLSQAFSLFITTLRITWTVFDWLLTPVKPYLLLALFLFTTLYLAYCLIIYYALPRLPTFLLRSLGILLRPLGGWTVPTWITSLGLDLSSAVGDVDVGRAIGALSLPLSGLATTSCALLGVGCEASLYSDPQPFWRLYGGGGRGKGKGKPDIDDAQLAWALTQESRSARNIFESISTLGGKADVFEHIEIWKHGVAVSIESKLDDRNVLGKQLFELGDSSKSLHDEMRKIDSMTVTTFGNLHLEFNDLAGQLLSIQLLDPPDRSDTSVTLARRFDNILNRLDPKLDELILRVSHAVDIAQSALDQSKDTTMLLSQISHELNDEISSVPAWKRVSDQVGHYINGGQAPRSKTVRRDLRLVEAVVGDISSLLDNLERARSALLDYQSHTAGFKASLYGVHLAANGTLDLEAELRILTPLMSEFGNALDSAKEQRFGAGRLETRKVNVIDPPQA